MLATSSPSTAPNWAELSLLIASPEIPEPERQSGSRKLFQQITLLRDLGADVTVVCERPKISPHADAMRANLAQDLDVDIDAISIKATTTETLGFTGRGEGIAAHAVCLLERA